MKQLYSKMTSALIELIYRNRKRCRNIFRSKFNLPRLNDTVRIRTVLSRYTAPYTVPYYCAQDYGIIRTVFSRYTALYTVPYYCAQDYGVIRSIYGRKQCRFDRPGQYEGQKFFLFIIRREPKEYNLFINEISFSICFQIKCYIQSTIESIFIRLICNIQRKRLSYTVSLLHADQGV